MLPQEAERYAKRKLERIYKQEFIKEKILIGDIKREFDLVSNVSRVVAQVKTCQKKFEDLTEAQIATRFKRGYMFDCLLLEKAPSRFKERIFFLAADKKVFRKFKEWSKGLVSLNVNIIFIDAWK